MEKGISRDFFRLFLPKEDFLFLKVLLRNQKRLFSQLGQELLPLIYLDRLKIKQGYFVEIGANDGLKFSNTFNLEKIGWTGILIEPDPRT